MSTVFNYSSFKFITAASPAATADTARPNAADFTVKPVAAMYPLPAV